MSLKSYLANIGSQLATLGQEDEVHVTVGNESCDLDSIVCAISHAHWLAQRHSVAVPVLQCRREDFALRTDAVWLFDQLQLDHGHLLFSDDIIEILRSVGKVSLTLVDHAHPTGPLRQLPNMEVVRIIDHHPGVSPWQQGEVVMEAVGSCATLVAQQLLAGEGHVAISSDVATLLLGAILLDTVGLKEEAGRVTDKDKAMAEKLASLSVLPSDALYSKLSAARLSTAGLTMDQLLRKDLKIAEAGTYRMGFSSVTCQLAELLGREGSVQALHTLCQTSMLSALLVLGLSVMTDSVSRQIAVFQPQDSDLADGVAGVLENDSELQCQRIPADSVILLQQGNSRLSRKYILPAVVTFVTSLGQEEAGPPELIPEYTLEEETHNTRTHRLVMLSEEEEGVVDMEAIRPYRKIIQHGGYAGPERHAVMVLSACYLPTHSLPHYHNIIDNLFLYVMSVVQRIVVDDYIIVYLHSGAPRHSMPSIPLFHKFYRMVDRRLRKQLKHLYIVHPTFWVRSMLRMARPFVSSKFYRKVHLVCSLQQLPVSLETDLIPAPVTQADSAHQPRPSQPSERYTPTHAQ